MKIARDGFRGARLSPVLAKASRLRGCASAFATRSALIFPAIHVGRSSLRRAASTNARDERAPQNLPRHLSPNYHL